MPKEDSITVREIISSKFASIIFGITILLTGFFYFVYAAQVALLLPYFLPRINLWGYIIGIPFVVAGIAILANRPITRLASYLLVILLFCIAVVIDLRGIFNLPDEVRYIYINFLIKDLGLAAGAVIIANFPREDKRRHRHRHRSRTRY